MRNILVHCHMFKNAGSTLDWSLKRSFKRSFVDHRDDEPMRNESGYLDKYLDKHSKVKAFSSHHVVPPFTTANNKNILPIFLLRNPWDRVGSVYEFEKKQPTSTPGSEYAKKHSFDEYVAWRMRPDVGATIRSFQVRYCSGGVRRAKIDHTDFEKAARSLIDTPLVGIVEQYDESMVLFEEAIRPLFPEIDLAYVAQNTGKRRKKSLEERVQSIKDMLSDETVDEFKLYNEAEFKLYDFATDLLTLRQKAINDFEGKLERFRDRCERLA